MPVSALTAPTGSTPQVQGAITGINNTIAGINAGVSAMPSATTSVPAPTASTTSTAPTTQPTVLSSSNIDQKNQDNAQKVQSSATTQKGQSMDNGVVLNADRSIAEAPGDAVASLDPTTGQTVWRDSKGAMYALGPSSTVSQDPVVQGHLNELNQLKGQMDATGAANIENIKSMYSSYIQDQQKANAGAEANTQSLLIRGGSEQTASSSGIFHTQVSYGLKQIADLVTKENSATIMAQQAMQDGDFKILDKQLTIAEDARKERQAAAQKVADTISTAKVQQFKDTTIGGILSQGISSPTAILAHLKDAGITGITAKDVNDTIANLNPDAKEIHSMLLDLAKNDAPADIRTKVASATSLGDAISLAGRYLQDPTSLAGQFSAAQAAGYKGTPGDFVAAQKYKDAYATSSGTEAAKSAFANSSSNQQKLEQEGRAVILKETSNRSGGLGIQDAKVNQAIHLKALFDQYATTDPDTGKAVYNIPKSQYAEIATGLANLISPTGVVSDSLRKEIITRTAKGDINGAISYATGSPQNGSTQAVFQNLKYSVDRQGTVAEQERQKYVDNLAALLPTDLSSDRRAALLSGSSLNSYTDPSKNTAATMTPAQIDTDALTKITTWQKSDPKNASLLSELSKTFPNLSNVELAQKLKLIP
jgi:hypothetical protein